MVTIKLSNRVLYTLIAVIIAIAVIGVAYAAYPASNAGHNAGEVMLSDGKTIEQKIGNDVCLKNGTNCNPPSLSCVIKSVDLQVIKYVYCDLGYILVDCHAVSGANSADDGVACTSTSTLGKLSARCCKIA